MTGRTKQDEFNAVLNVLSKYSLRNQKYIEAKSELLDNAKKFYEGREKFEDLKLKNLKIKLFQLTIMIKIADLKTMMRKTLRIIMVNVLIDHYLI